MQDTRYKIRYWRFCEYNDEEGKEGGRRRKREGSKNIRKKQGKDRMVGKQVNQERKGGRGYCETSFAGS